MFAFSAGDPRPVPPPSPRPGAPTPAGLADRVRPATPVAGRTLPVPPPLAPLFPGGSLRRGTTTTVAGAPGHGATTLALALLAAASEAGSWCAAVGLPDPGVVAAAGLGLDLRRVVFVPHPGNGWAEAAGDLLSGVDAVLVRPPGRARLTAARHLIARARDRQAALVVLLEGPGAWPEGGDLALSVGRSRWEGVGRGHGHLRGRRAEVRVSGRRPPAGSASARCGSPPARARSRTWRRKTWRQKSWGRRSRSQAAQDGRSRAGAARGDGPDAASGEGLNGAVEKKRGTVGRHLVPRLLEEGARGEEARRFARVLERAGELCPWVHPVRLGVGALPARGPARFFGGEEAVVSRLAGIVGEEATIGVADGLFAAVLAARSGLIVPPGGTADFLAPWSVATLARPDLAVTLQRLGVTTLGQFAALPAASISDRFGADAAACHAVARGESGELAGLRDRGIERRLRVARGEDPDRGADAPPPPSQPGFFGGASEADARAARSFVRVQERLGIEAVLMGRLRGGRDPAGQSVLVPWGSPEAEPRPGRSAPRGRAGCRRPHRPTCCGVPPRAEVVDAAGRRRARSAGGACSRPAIERLSVDGRSLAAGRWRGPAPGR